jgi:hypothetical protein
MELKEECLKQLRLELESQKKKHQEVINRCLPLQ